MVVVEREADEDPSDAGNAEGRDANSERCVPAGPNAPPNNWGEGVAAQAVNNVPMTRALLKEGNTKRKGGEPRT